MMLKKFGNYEIIRSESDGLRVVETKTGKVIFTSDDNREISLSFLLGTIFDAGKESARRDMRKTLGLE